MSPPRPRSLEPTSLRRVPTQERSKRRFEAILDAAALVFSSAGFEGATMEEIAARAGTSIGSVYQFFPNKTALFEAIAERTLARIDALLAGALGERAAELGWEELLDVAIDALVAFHEADPGIRAMWMNLQMYGAFEEADRKQTERVVGLAEGLLALYAPALSEERRAIVAATIVNVVGTMLVVAVRGARARPAARRRAEGARAAVPRGVREPGGRALTRRRQRARVTRRGPPRRGSSRADR